MADGKQYEREREKERENGGLIRRWRDDPNSRCLLSS